MHFSTFGHQRIRDELPTPVEAMLRKVTVGLDSISTKLILQESYETLYNIFNHDNPAVSKTRPLALVALHPKENASEYSKLYRFFYRYTQHRINELFGISATEMLELPHEIVEKMFEISAQQAKKETPGIESALRDLERTASRG